MFKFKRIIHLVILNLLKIKNLKFEIPMCSIGVVGKRSISAEGRA